MNGDERYLVELSQHPFCRGTRRSARWVSSVDATVDGVLLSQFLARYKLHHNHPPECQRGELVPGKRARFYRPLRHGHLSAHTGG